MDNLLVQVGSWSKPRLVHACDEHTVLQVTLGCDDCSACQRREAQVRERLNVSGTEHRFVPMPEDGLFLELGPITDGRDVVTFLSDVLDLPISRVN